MRSRKESDRVRMSGHAGGTRRGTGQRCAGAARAKRRRSLWIRLGRGLLFLCCAFVIASILLVAIYRVLPPPATPLMLLRIVQGHGLAKSWRSLDAISPNLVRAVIAGEDARFCRHHGFDWDAIEAAWERYESGRGRLVGASTLSMQTAKNLFLWPGRDWPRKALEAWFTVLLELSWSKHRIIEVYLNIIEWGPGIYGAEAAARQYFDKPAAQLSASDAARLAAVIPDPLDRAADRPGRAVRRRAAFILAQIPALPVRDPLPCGEPR
jgi:monofunctional biosynthetic peptidoglycan transglycosylase